jgi:hypothetical protein
MVTSPSKAAASPVGGLEFTERLFSPVFVTDKQQTAQYGRQPGHTYSRGNFVTLNCGE